MKLIDLVIIAALVLYCGYVMYRRYKNGKLGSCGGECGSCGSSALCHLDFKKIKEEIKETEVQK